MQQAKYDLQTCTSAFFFTSVAMLLSVQVKRQLYDRIVNVNKNTKEARTLTSIQLTPLDAQLYKFDMPPISTFTWLKGCFEETAEPILRERLELIVAKNPWLLGRINIKNRKAFLHYPARLDTSEVVSKMDLDGMIHVVSPSASPISRNTEIGQIVKKVCIEQGLTIGNSPTDAIFKVFIIPCRENPNSRFGVLIQMSHVIADGATYYELVNMLCTSDKENIISLNAERKFFEKELFSAMGSEEAEYQTSNPWIARFVVGLIKNAFSKNRLSGHYAFIDASEFQQVKLYHAKLGSVPYVSTNDVITSWFMNQVGTQTAVMAINLRKRLNCLSDSDAGNYQNSLFYRKEDYASPALIRKSVQQLRRVITVNQKLPTILEAAFEPESLISNWASFSKPFEIEGCEEELHLPIGDTRYWPCSVPLLIIFRAGQGKIGLAYYIGEDHRVDLDVLTNPRME